MSLKNIAVLTSKESWFIPYARNLVKILRCRNFNAGLFFSPKKIGKKFSVVFILSYFEVLKDKFLSDHLYNLVVHESDLPKGRGWAPFFWQVLEGKNKIPIVLFSANKKIDSGDIYLKDFIKLNGNELYSELRGKQAQKTIELCLKFLNKHKTLKPLKQKGKSSYYKKRNSLDSRLDINSNIKGQFNLLRIVNNESFPAYFNYKGKKYILKIYEESSRYEKFQKK